MKMVRKVRNNAQVRAGNPSSAETHQQRIDRVRRSLCERRDLGFGLKRQLPLLLECFCQLQHGDSKVVAARAQQLKEHEQLRKAHNALSTRATDLESVNELLGARINELETRIHELEHQPPARLPLEQPAIGSTKFSVASSNLMYEVYLETGLPVERIKPIAGILVFDDEARGLLAAGPCPELLSQQLQRYQERLACLVPSPSTMRRDFAVIQELRLSILCRPLADQVVHVALDHATRGGRNHTSVHVSYYDTAALKVASVTVSIGPKPKPALECAQAVLDELHSGVGAPFVLGLRVF